MKKVQSLKLFVAFAIALLVLTPSFSTHAQSTTEAHKIQKRSILHPPHDYRNKVIDSTTPTFASIGLTVSPGSDSNSTFNFEGTGFVVGKNTFVTNNHVAIKFRNANPINKGATNSAWFYPGRDGDYLPFGKFKIIDVAYSPNADIAVVTVGKQNDLPYGKELGDVVAPLKVKKFSTTDRKVTISGYPGEKNKTQWYDTNRVEIHNFDNLESPTLMYDIDTTPGQSGSPIFNTSHEVVGVHSNGGRGNNGNLRNLGQRLNSVNYNFIMKRVNEENQKLYTSNADRWVWN
ncbi:serine protease [Listeria sp. PSOL-1]|uniref:trypsin-like serine peptidase n=1 Tax=Listeria sp. PSOL-1 TaxID=1844999 RepID=UPI0013D1570B|nr:trypsin-like peptidase domain-containing protein [Listeria sp. PSOL-1]